MSKAVVHRELGNRIKIVDPSRVTTNECLYETRRAACSDAFICLDGGLDVASASFGLLPRELGFFACGLHQTEPALELVATLASHSVKALPLLGCDAVLFRKSEADLTTTGGHRVSASARLSLHGRSVKRSAKSRLPESRK